MHAAQAMPLLQREYTHEYGSLLPLPACVCMHVCVCASVMVAGVCMPTGMCMDVYVNLVQLLVRVCMYAHVCTCM
jgi:hypothetical protein